MRLQQLIFQVTPTRLHCTLRDAYSGLKLLPNFYYDFRRYLAYSGMNRSRRYRGTLSARITMAYHQLEKGLSLASPRPGFGKAAVERLLESMRLFIIDYGCVAPATTAAGVLNKYIEFNTAQGIDMTALKACLKNLLDEGESTPAKYLEGGTVLVNRAEITDKFSTAFKEFFNSRYSVRHFSGAPISAADLAEAVTISQKTPSVCNRQAWRVHAYAQKDKMARLLEIQDGNGGFGDQLSLLLIVTCDLTCFIDAGERYQAWIDGGMFSMSLCLAFHSLGLGTCCLNWSKERGDDIALRAVAGIDGTEQIIMMIGVGTLPETFHVAYSARRALDDVLKIH